MNEFVIDASALALALTNREREGAELRMRIDNAECHAPHLVDAEVGNVLRRREMAGDISPSTALTALQALPELVDHRYRHVGQLAKTAWRLRGSITFYDALYVALAKGLSVPLVTSDGRLSRTPKLPCKVEVVA